MTGPVATSLLLLSGSLQIFLLLTLVHFASVIWARVKPWQLFGLLILYSLNSLVFVGLLFAL